MSIISRQESEPGEWPGLENATRLFTELQDFVAGREDSSLANFLVSDAAALKTAWHQADEIVGPNLEVEWDSVVAKVILRRGGATTHVVHVEYNRLFGDIRRAFFLQFAK